MSPHTTSLAPEFDVTVHIVFDDFGKPGRAYRETAEEATNFDTVVDDLLSGQFNNPVRAIAFNTSEGWSRDVSEDAARELLRRAAKEDKPLGASRRFVELHRKIRAEPAARSAVLAPQPSGCFGDIPCEN